MRRNVTTRLARTRAEARDYRSTKSLEGFQIHCLAHAFCNSLNSGGECACSNSSWVTGPLRPRSKFHQKIFVCIRTRAQSPRLQTFTARAAIPDGGCARGVRLLSEVAGRVAPTL